MHMEYYEDNLSIAFALCLKYDTLFLDIVLRQVVTPNLYETLFNTDYPNYHILIDLQKRPTECGSFSNVVAVACTASQIDFNNIDDVIARETNNPECDLILEVNDTC